jgi:hypothetical protein
MRTGAVVKHLLFNTAITPGELVLAMLAAFLITFGAARVIVHIAASLAGLRKLRWK